MTKKFIFWVFFAIFIGAVVFLIWRMQDGISITDKLSNFGGMGGKSDSAFENYEVRTNKYGDEFYYTISNVVSEAVKDKDGRKKYFRAGFTISVNRSGDMPLLQANSQLIIEEIRNTLSTMQVGEARGQELKRIKTQIKNNVNKKLGKNVIKDIYFDEILGQ